MVRQPVPLKIAIADFPHTLAVKNGSIPIDGVTPEFVNVVPQIAAFRRMVRQVEFDVCELAATTYIVARAHKAPFQALPIFVHRMFHHGGMLVRPDAGIRHPKDLEGRNVGVRAYTVTTGVWTRGVLMDEYGLDNSKMTWFVDDEEHVTQLTLPANARRVPPGSSLVDMMADGRIVAGMAGNAGLGRTGAPAEGWNSMQVPAVEYPDLIPDAKEREAAWYVRTGIYPMHGTIVVKNSVLAEHPWIARALYDAFEQAKTDWLKTLHDGSAQTPGDQKYRVLAKIVGSDPLPYGLEANAASVRYLEDTAFRQGLIPQRMTMDELFFDSATL